MWITDLNRFVSGRWGSSNDKLAVAGVDVATDGDKNGSSYSEDGLG